MRFLSSFFIFTLLLAGCGAGETVLPLEEDPEGEPAQENSYDPIIYVSVFTHNEQENGKETPDFSENEDIFWEQRNLVATFADMLYEKGVPYNFQSDWNFLEAMVKFDEGTPETNGKNLLRYLSEDLGASIDPHNHASQSGYNYADVAYLMDSLGVEPSGVVGGFLAYPIEDSELEFFWNPIEGKIYDYTWTPEVLWGGGTSGHAHEEGMWISGVWRPASAEAFTTHDPEAPLPLVGNYSRDWEGLEALLAMQENGELTPGQIYTISIDAHQKHLSDEYIKEYAERIDSFQTYVDAGRMQWASIGEVAEIWTEQYEEAPGQLFYLGEDVWESLQNSFPQNLKGNLQDKKKF